MLPDKLCENQWEKLNCKYIQEKEMLPGVAFVHFCFSICQQITPNSRPLCFESHFLWLLTEAIPFLQVSVILNFSIKRNNELTEKNKDETL